MIYYRDRGNVSFAETNLKNPTRIKKTSSQHRRHKARKEKKSKVSEEDCLARRWRHYVDSKNPVSNLPPFWHAARLGPSR